MRRRKPIGASFIRAVSLSTLLSLTSAAELLADWPQWGGASRNFTADSKGLADSWPPSGPHRLWKSPLGDGYAGIAAVDGRLYTMYRAQEREHVVSLAAETGETLWNYHYPAPFLSGTDLAPGPGPHATPLVVDNRVCTVGVTGILCCLEAGSGELLWSHRLIDELKGTKLYRGYSASLIAYHDTVLAAVGGPGRAVVAFRISDGEIKWQQQDFQTSHASPLLIQFAGEDQLVLFADKEITALDPANGELIWRHPYPLGGGHIASMPVWGDDGRLFVSSAYGEGSHCLQLTREGNKTVVNEIWLNKKMRVHHSNAVRVGDYVYASSGDFGPKLFMAIHIASGKIAWRDRGLTRASSLYADGKLIILEEDGKLSLATISPAGLKIHSQVSLFTQRAWTPPTLVGKRLYVRNQKEIMAYELP